MTRFSCGKQCAYLSSCFDETIVLLVKEMFVIKVWLRDELKK